MKRVCTECSRELDLSSFTKDNRRKSGYGAKCRDCTEKRALRNYHKRRSKGPEEAERLRRNRLKSVYGISSEDYNDLFQKQNGCCVICGKHQNEFERRLCVDHCHKTGIVRGLLCTKCNAGLGNFDEDFSRFEKAMLYLKMVDRDS